jgi:hypothetical protein
MSGALAIANSDSQPYDYRGTEFGTLNGFSSNVVMTQGSYSTGSGFQSPSPSGIPNAVQAVVTQCQSQSLSLVLYRTNCTDANGSHDRYVTIKAQAVASVNKPNMLPCALALNGPVTFQDAAVQVNAPNCTIASNGKPIGIDFKVAPKQLNVGSLSTSGGCSGSLCGSVSPPVITYAPRVIDPFSALKSAMSNLTLPPCKNYNPNPNKKNPKLFPYTASTPCANDANDPTNFTSNGDNAITTSGVYFFSTLTLTGGGILHTCTVGDPDPACSGVTQNVSATIILLPNPNSKSALLSMTGNSSINITAPTTAPSALPGQLGSVANLLKNMAILDLETSPTIGGTSTMSGSGVFYLPNADPLNYQGNPTSSSSTCTLVIAASIKFSGTPNFDNLGCPDDIIPKSQVVVLVK